MPDLHESLNRATLIGLEAREQQLLRDLKLVREDLREVRAALGQSEVPITPPKAEGWLRRITKEMRIKPSPLVRP